MSADMLLRVLCVAGTGVLPVPAAHAADLAADLALIGGYGDDVTVAAAAIRMRDWKTWKPGGRWNYAVSGEWQLGRWNAQQADAGPSTIVDGSLTSVLRMTPAEDSRSAYYMEFGFGVHLLSDHDIGERHLGTHFQFGEFFGVGTQLGARRQYALGLRVQHVSNGSISSENDGVTFAEMVVRYSF
jgi:lipid A 3-O-deacylase